MLHDAAELAVVHALVGKLEDMRRDYRNREIVVEAAPETTGVKTYEHVVPESDDPRDHQEGNCPCSPTVREASVIHQPLSAVPCGMDTAEVAAQLKRKMQEEKEVLVASLTPGVQDVTMALLERALAGFVERNNSDVAKARAVLDQFGLQRLGNAMDLDPAKRQALYEALNA